MSRLTTRFGLLALETGENPWQLGGKFFNADRDLIDLLLYLALSGHVHDGVTGATEAPETAAEGTVAFTGGQLPASTRLFYTYTLVADDTGLESGMAPVTTIDTPEQIESPAGPTLTRGSASGTLLPGAYYYRLSAYTEVNTAESLAENVQAIQIPIGTVTNRVILDLPELPTGATGFNIYRRDPGSTDYYYLDSVDMDVATPPDEYVDDGTTELDCDRVYPTRNTSFATNAITIELPDDVTPLPAGFHWRLYRSVDADDWSSSLLSDVVEETFEGSGIYTTSFLDEGGETLSGEPPTTTLEYGSPEKIDLTDAAHVQGYLPMGRVSGFPIVVELAFPGIQQEGAGEAQWQCPFEQAIVVSATAALGRGGSTPAATDLIADVEIGRGTTPVYTSVYAAEADMPTIDVGDNKADGVFPATGTAGNRAMVAGDVLSGTIIQDGGSGTPTDEDLTITVLLYVKVGSEDTSLTWD